MTILKKAKFATLFGTALLCTVGFSAEAFAAPVTIGLPAKKQEQSNWCWAGSSQAVLGYYGKSVTQTAFVTRVKGSAVNQTATFPETRYGLEGWGKTGTYVNGLAFSTLASEIGTYRRPVMAGWFWNDGGGHMVVAYGTDSANQFVYYMDPWYGSYYYASYSWFKGGAGTSSDHDWAESLYQIR